MTIGGSLLASRERPYNDTSPDMSQGTPSEGKSVGIAPFTLSCSFLPTLADALIAINRSIGSSRVVARLTIIIDTWLFGSVLPASRKDTGTPAISGLAGWQS